MEERKQWLERQMARISVVLLIMAFFANTDDVLMLLTMLITAGILVIPTLYQYEKVSEEIKKAKNEKQ